MKAQLKKKQTQQHQVLGISITQWIRDTAEGGGFPTL